MNNLETSVDTTIIDTHVHIIGDGSSGSGCRLTLQSPFHKILARFIVHSWGLPISVLSTGLDTVFVEYIVQMVKGSSVDKAIILAHEQPYNDSGQLIENFGSFYTPNDYVLRLAHLYPDYFLPGIAIHPARPDCLDELDKCAEQGASLLKLLPLFQNINCSDKRYTKFWERLADYHIPFLAHTGGELSVPVFNKSYASPEYLRLPLECGVNVIAAHCGTSSLFFDTNYLDTFIKMTKEYPNLYGDNSGMNTPIRSRHFKTILKEELKDRIIYGSDQPIPISATWNCLRGLISITDWQKAQKTKNLMERDVIIKKALGFDNASFSRIKNLLPSVKNKTN